MMLGRVETTQSDERFSFAIFFVRFITSSFLLRFFGFGCCVVVFHVFSSFFTGVERIMNVPSILRYPPIGPSQSGHTLGGLVLGVIEVGVDQMVLFLVSISSYTVGAWGKSAKVLA